MPGLVCIIGSGARQAHERDLNAMLRVMLHEPFYSSGTYVNPDLGVYAGWACHRGSYCDCLPVRNERGDLVLLFYGEHFGDDHGGPEAANESARCILRAIEVKGAACLEQLNGWFHGVLLDLRRREVIVFNDRYGVQRLNYCEEPSGVLLAAEAKCLLAVRPELRRIDERALGEFVACNCVLESRTLFKNVFTLPGGSAWRFQDGRLVARRRYFKPENWEGQPALDRAAFYHQMEALWGRVMARYTRSSLPLGISLTGGLDTRLVMAHLPKERGRFPCYTFSGMHRESYDVKIARRVARACGCQHQVLPLDGDFLRNFGPLSEKTVYVSDGCFSACGAYELFLNKLAREVAVVRLTGNYGSEVFRAVRAFKATTPRPGLVHPDFEPQIRSAICSFEAERDCSDLTFAVFKQAPCYGFSRISVEQSQVVLRTPFMDNDLVALMYRAPETERSRRELQLRLIERGDAALARIPTDRAVRGRWGGLASPWAWLVSWFLFKADYYYKSGMPHWAERLHYWLGPFQPEKLVVGRHRFTHFRIWFRNELAGHIQEVLLDPAARRRGYFKGDFIEHMVRRHVKGDRNYTDEIDMALTLELVHRLFVDAGREGSSDAGPQTGEAWGRTSASSCGVLGVRKLPR